MNNETLNRLNAFIADYKKESEEKDAIIKQQNQTLLRISAELEAVKQCDPFNSVFIAYSVENISNMIETLTEQSTNEDCIGCAGPCKVVDVAAKLQEELDAKTAIIKNFKILETRETDRLHKIIEKLKDRNIEDLHELYDIYEAELRGIKADRTSIKSDRDIMFQNYRNTIAKLREDSAVLMKVVDVVNDDTISRFAVPWRIRCIVEDYLDAPGGPPETPIDDLYKVTVTYAFLEMP
jgi:hypothetical protein